MTAPDGDFPTSDPGPATSAGAPATWGDQEARAKFEAEHPDLATKDDFVIDSPEPVVPVEVQFLHEDDEDDVAL